MLLPLIQLLQMLGPGPAAATFYALRSEPRRLGGLVTVVASPTWPSR